MFGIIDYLCRWAVECAEHTEVEVDWDYVHGETCMEINDWTYGMPPF